MDQIKSNNKSDGFYILIYNYLYSRSLINKLENRFGDPSLLRDDIVCYGQVWGGKQGRFE